MKRRSDLLAENPRAWLTSCPIHKTETEPKPTLPRLADVSIFHSHSLYPHVSRRRGTQKSKCIPLRESPSSRGTYTLWILPNGRISTTRISGGQIPRPCPPMEADRIQHLREIYRKKYHLPRPDRLLPHHCRLQNIVARLQKICPGINESVSSSHF